MRRPRSNHNRSAAAPRAARCGLALRPPTAAAPNVPTRLAIQPIRVSRARRCTRALGALVGAGLLWAAANAGVPPATLAPFSAASDRTPPPPWQQIAIARQAPATRYEVVTLDGSRVLRAAADGAHAILLHPLDEPLRQLRTLQWRWRVDRFPAGADLSRKAGDDTAARVCALFDVPGERLALAVRLRLAIGRRLFDPQLPAAAVCYVWDAHLPAGTRLPNAYTDRVQLIVLRSGAPGQWHSERRDLHADFAAAFPAEAAAGPVPVRAIGLTTDSDNTGATALGYYGDFTLSAEAP